jgi:hypothetical protein
MRRSGDSPFLGTVIRQLSDEAGNDKAPAVNWCGSLRVSSSPTGNGPTARMRSDGGVGALGVLPLSAYPRLWPISNGSGEWDA